MKLVRFNILAFIHYYYGPGYHGPGHRSPHGISPNCYHGNGPTGNCPGHHHGNSPNVIVQIIVMVIV